MVLYQMGVTRAFQQKWNEAVDLLNRALAIDSGIAYAYDYRGVSYGRLDRKDRLINDLTRFLQLAPNSPEAPRARTLVQAASL